MIQRHFSPDFGVNGNWTTANGAAHTAAIEAHLSSPTTRVILGTYRGDPVTHYVDPGSALDVLVSAAGDFISGWRLNAAQLANVLARGSL
jgi:hypothetical protein